MKNSILARIAKLEAKQARPGSTFPSVVVVKGDETFEQRRATLEAEGYIYDPRHPPLIVCITRLSEDLPEEDKFGGAVRPSPIVGEAADFPERADELEPSSGYDPYTNYNLAETAE